MLQRVCEKCGKVIPCSFRRNILKYKVHYTSMLLHRDDSSPFIEIDLCNRCRDLFDEWLDEKPREGE